MVVVVEEEEEHCGLDYNPKLGMHIAFLTKKGPIKVNRCLGICLEVR